MAENKPTLLVLAAGMGSRYGSLKQMDGIGPNGEAIIDYSIFDAYRAGFGKVVFVIRHSFEKDFKTVFNDEHFGGKIKIEYVFQELDYLPEGFKVPAEREKPWGTNHALLMAAPVIHEPFAVINADDFYGADAYKTIGEYLKTLGNSKNKYCMVGYEVDKTLSDNGTVSRGVCKVDEEGNLVSMVERTAIEAFDNRIIYTDEEGGKHDLPANTVVSMNLFGFTPDYFNYSEEFFKEFLKENIEKPKAEFFIPTLVNKLIADGVAKLRVLNSSAQWFGVTYKADRPSVVANIKALIEKGDYPEHLWK